MRMTSQEFIIQLLQGKQTRTNARIQRSMNWLGQSKKSVFYSRSWFALLMANTSWWPVSAATVPPQSLASR